MSLEKSEKEKNHGKFLRTVYRVILKDCLALTLSLVNRRVTNSDKVPDDGFQTCFDESGTWHWM